MGDIKTFHLPDLGEGLPDATIVEWLVKEGDTVKLDAPLVSMETAKAVVEVPVAVLGQGREAARQAWRRHRNRRGAGRIRARSEDAAARRRRSDRPSSRPPNRKRRPAAAPHDAPQGRRFRRGRRDRRERQRRARRRRHRGRRDADERSRAFRTGDAASAASRPYRPCVRWPRSSKVDLTRVAPSGAGGVVTLQDVKNAAADGTARPRRRARARACPSAPVAARTRAAAPGHLRSEQARTHALSPPASPMRTTPPTRARQRPTRSAQGRSPQHGARDGRCAREGRADHARRRCRYHAWIGRATTSPAA